MSLRNLEIPKGETYEMSILPIYIFGALANALVSSINSRKQRILTEKQGLDARELQRELHHEGYKQQIANQFRAFDLTHGWPLATAPCEEDLRLCDEKIPLFLIIAPPPQKGIQSKLTSLWTNLKTYLLATFRLDGDRPIVPMKYRSDCAPNPTDDIMTIYRKGMKHVPTLYIAPYSTDCDDVLGLIIAFWGLGSSRFPQIVNFELNIRKLYVDKIRDEALDYKRRCDMGKLPNNDHDGKLPLSMKSPIEINLEVFLAEKKLFDLDGGNDFDFLDKSLDLYKSITATRNAYNAITNSILPIFELIAVAIADLYFVLEYDVSPKFPGWAKGIVDNLKGEIPDINARGISEQLGEFTLMTGRQFVDGLERSYLRAVAYNISPYMWDLCKSAFACWNSDYISEFNAILVKRSGGTPGKANYNKGSRSQGQIIASANVAIDQKDYRLAFELLSSISSNVEAKVTLGEMYIRGQGCRQNRNLGIEYLMSCAAAGSSRACRLLYFALKNTNLCRALSYLNKAAEARDLDALFILASLYLDKGDIDHATVLYLQGANLGDRRSVEQLRKIKGVV